MIFIHLLDRYFILLLLLSKLAVIKYKLKDSLIFMQKILESAQ